MCRAQRYCSRTVARLSTPAAPFLSLRSSLIRLVVRLTSLKPLSHILLRLVLLVIVVIIISTLALLELDGSSQTRNLIFVLRVHIGDNVVFAWWDLLGQIDILLNLNIAFVQRALQIDILDRVTQIGGLLDDRDEPVLDLKVDFGAFLDFLIELAGGGDSQCLAR